MGDYKDNCSSKCSYKPVYRGTSPAFMIMFPEDFDARTIDSAYLTFDQAGRTILEKDISSMDVDSEQPNVVVFTLSQDDTLSFRAGSVNYQMRFKVGDLLYATDEWNIEVKRILKDGQI